MMYALYRVLTGAGTPLFERLLRRRLAQGKEEAARLDERRGIAARARPPGPVLWLHGASVGEANSLLPLLAALEQRLPEAHFLVTTGTLTSAGLMARRLGPRAIHQYLPLDAPGWVTRFLSHWKPALGILVESELWPNLIETAGRQGIALALVNGRISARSAQRWRAMAPLARRLLGRFALIAAQSHADAARFASLGAPAVATPGNLKYAGASLPCDAAAAAALTAAIGDRPCLAFASTHEGEEKIALTLHRTLSVTFPRLLTIIVPRHPERGAAILQMIARAGLRARVRSAGALPEEGDAFHIADTLGELGTLFAAVKIVVMGGSLLPFGGHNPLEPAASGCAVVCGAHMENFAEIAARLEAAGALLRTRDDGELTVRLSALLADRAAVDAQGARARAEVANAAQVLPALMQSLEPLIVQARRQVAA